jgi:hypothetical protein
MTFIWLVVWLIAGTPAVASWGPWNNWGTALFVCLSIDVVGALGTHGTRSGRQRARDGAPDERVRP